eukprot:m.127855 g.127855  ORF g.127855 m.127855 type:complete len:57 (-) comp52274_c0_seq11:19-189(-)
MGIHEAALLLAQLGRKHTASSTDWFCQLAAPTRSDASRSCGLPVCSLFVVFVDKEI